jgi:predicted PurR-regulated permease PerM
MADTAQRPPQPQPEAPRQLLRPTVDLAQILLAAGALLLLIGGSLYIVHPFVPALIWGTTIVTTTWPLMLKLQQLLGGRRWLAVTIMLLAEIVVICIPTYGAVSTLADRADEIMDFVRGLPTYSLPSPPQWLSGIPLTERFTQEWQRLSEAGPGGILARIEPYAAVVAKWLLVQMGLVGAFALHLVLMIIVCGLLYAKGEAAVELVTALALRVAPGNGAGIVHLTGQSIRAIALGVVVTALVQAAMGSAGIWLARIPFAAVLSALMFVTCLVQLGPLLPMLGCVLWLFMHDSHLTAIVLLVWAICVSALDNVLRPILIRRAVALPMVLILTGVLGGLIAMGPAGLFIGPVILAVTYHLLLAWIALPNRAPAQSDPAGPAEAAPAAGLASQPTDRGGGALS